MTWHVPNMGWCDRLESYRVCRLSPAGSFLTTMHGFARRLVCFGEKAGSQLAKMLLHWRSIPGIVSVAHFNSNTGLPTLPRSDIIMYAHIVPADFSFRRAARLPALVGSATCGGGSINRGVVADLNLRLQCILRWEEKSRWSVHKYAGGITLCSDVVHWRGDVCRYHTLSGNSTVFHCGSWASKHPACWGCYHSWLLVWGVIVVWTRMFARWKWTLASSVIPLSGSTAPLETTQTNKTLFPLTSGLPWLLHNILIFTQFLQADKFTLLHALLLSLCNLVKAALLTLPN